MPRAFLITNRRYNSSVEFESRENSPERSVWTAESTDVRPVLQAASPHSPATFPRDDFSLSPVKCLNAHSSPDFNLNSDFQQLNNLEQLAEISLVTAYRPLISPPTPVGSPWPIADADGTHVCPECGKHYSTSSNLARHRQTHRSVSDKKARKCPHCEKVYVSMPAFSMHVRTHSQGCQCPYCGKCFSRPWLLQGHIRTHTGEKPFKCHVCNKAFADKSNLRAHVQTHSDTKPYVCQRCGKAFALKSYLYKHEESSCVRFQRQEKRSA